MFRSLNRRWRCCPRQSQTGRGSPLSGSSPPGWAPEAQVLPPSVCPWPTSFPFRHPPLSLFYLGCPGTFPLVCFFSPHSHCSVDKGISTHPLSLTLFLCKQTRALRAGMGELEQPVGNSLGGPASHCGTRLAGPGFDPGKESSKPKEQTSVKTK